MTARPILLVTDLDRTVIPNGPAPEPPDAREAFREFTARDGVFLAYASGRDAGLIREAIVRWDLPVPAFAAGDVGTTLYRIDGDDWKVIPEWDDAIAPDWAGQDRSAVARVVGEDPDLTLQEEGRQGRFKLSYYVPASFGLGAGPAAVRRRLDAAGLKAAVVCSVDEVMQRGLLDVIPASATKLHATRFLMRTTGIDEDRTVFAGDSGNDLAALSSGLQAVVVGNATDEVRMAAVDGARAAGVADRLYVARRPYAGGVLEGVRHFLPDVT